MRQILVAVFDTVANADRAVQALENANIPSASIRRYHRDDPAMENLGTRTSTHVGPVSTAAVDADRVHQRSSGFWAWLTGEEGGTTDPTYESDHAYYGRHIDSGSLEVLHHDRDRDAAAVGAAVSLGEDLVISNFGLASGPA